MIMFMCNNFVCIYFFNLNILSYISPFFFELGYSCIFTVHAISDAYIILLYIITTPRDLKCNIIDNIEWCTNVPILPIEYAE